MLKFFRIACFSLLFLTLSPGAQGDGWGTRAHAQLESPDFEGAPIESTEPSGTDGQTVIGDYDPWEPFNEAMFEFNRGFDRYLLKPIATGYNAIMPDPAQKSVRNAIDNLGVVRRVVNNTLQGKFLGAGKELTRFTINSTIGVAGLFDVAKDGLGIEPSDQDTGVTLGFYGLDQGPYLVLPFLPVTTVRDGVGTVADTLMNPLVWLTPFYVPLGIAVTDTINSRSLNLDKFEQVEESTIDLYGAVRNGYLQSRRTKVEDAIEGE